MDHVLRLRDCLEDVQKERRRHNARIISGVYARMLPEYKEAMAHLKDVEDPEERDYLKDLLERGEHYEANP